MDLALAAGLRRPARLLIFIVISVAVIALAALAPGIAAFRFAGPWMRRRCVHPGGARGLK
jgi:hypothetical protein